jgi:hypothetical protein
MALESIDYQLEILDWFQDQRTVLGEQSVRGIGVYLFNKEPYG